MKILILVNGKTFAPEVALSFQKSNIHIPKVYTQPCYHKNYFYFSLKKLKTVFIQGPISL